GVTISLNATAGLVTSFDLNEQSLEDADYTDGREILQAEAYVAGDGAGGYLQQGYHYEGNDAELAEDQIEYGGEQAENEIYPDEVLDIEINDPLDDEFQEDDYSQDYSGQQTMLEVHVESQNEGQDEEASTHLMEAEEGENETEQEEDLKEESDEEEDDDEESGRLRFKSERTDNTVIRLSDAASKRRNIPETLGASRSATQLLLF
ncbi:RBM33 protein, partial [Amia calva]|nr:RBM33 protein [Amia calva]